MDNYDNVIFELERQGFNPELDGSGHRAKCPGHGGKDRNLKLSRGTNGAPVVVRCHSHQCSVRAIADGLGLPVSVFMSESYGDDATHFHRTPTFADADTRDRIYSATFKHLGLDYDDLMDLADRRGLGSELATRLAERAEYATLGAKRKRVAAQVAAEHPQIDLASVPGFRVTDSELSITGNGGLAIPVRDIEGRITGVVTRITDDAKAAEGGRYRWWSSSAVGGPAAKPSVHHPVFDGPRDVVRITEGPLKADVTTELSSVWTLGIPGVTSWQLAIDSIQQLGPIRVLIAMDSDLRTNPAVADAVVNLVRAVRKLGISVAVEIWDPGGGKGIDDLLVAGGVPTIIEDPQEIDELLATIGVREKEEPSSDWPEIDPIDDSLPPVDPFVYDLLPESLRAWVADIADRMQCPPDFVAVSAVLVLATLVGKQVGIRPKRYDDWTVIPNLWGLVVGRPSVMKSPAMSEPMRMLRYFEVLEKERYDERAKHAKVSAILTESHEKVIKQQIAKAQKDKKLEEAERLAMSLAVADEGVQPRRRYFTNDSTVEKLQLLCAENPNGLLVYRDEVRGLASRLDKEEYGHERAFYLEGWNGTTSSTVDRIGRGTVDCKSVVLSVLGGIQPSRLQSYVNHAVRGGSGDDGLIQRFQLMVWPDCEREFVNVDRWPDSTSKSVALDLYKAVENLDVSGAMVDEGDDQPYVRFTPDAQSRFDEWRIELERELRSGDLPEHLESHLAKYRSLVPSLALLLHLADHPVGNVGREALFAATRWATYLRSHAERVYRASVREPGIQSAGAVLDKIRSGHLQDGFTLKDVYHQQWRHLTSREGALAAMTVLTMRNYVRLKRSQGAVGRPSEHYEIHPQFLKSL